MARLRDFTCTMGTVSGWILDLQASSDVQLLYFAA